MVTKIKECMQTHCLGLQFGATFYTKVFWVFVFGHFFCPFLKRGFTFVQKAAPILAVSIMM
jgi:hypothetical protein